MYRLTLLRVALVASLEWKPNSLRIELFQLYLSCQIKKVCPFEGSARPFFRCCCFDLWRFRHPLHSLAEITMSFSPLTVAFKQGSVSSLTATFKMHQLSIYKYIKFKVPPNRGPLWLDDALDRIRRNFSSLKSIPIHHRELVGVFSLDINRLWLKNIFFKKNAKMCFEFCSLNLDFSRPWLLSIEHKSWTSVWFTPQLAVLHISQSEGIKWDTIIRPSSFYYYNESMAFRLTRDRKQALSEYLTDCSTAGIVFACRQMRW